MKTTPDLKPSDGPSLGAPTRESEEMAYRRGFAQGACAAIEGARQLAQGVTLAKLDAWLARISKWRSKRHRGKVEFPEWIGRK